MAKAWKIIAIIVGIALLLGTLCIAVGFLTGGSMERIMSQAVIGFDIDTLRITLTDLFHKLVGMLPLG